jgi:predicted nucleic acid-binding protein
VAETFVLDAYALLALFQDEPGAARMQEIIEKAQQADDSLFMTTVNLGEIAYGLQTKRGLDATIRGLAAIAAAPIKIVDADYALALHAARLKASTGAGYLDCFAAALAENLTGTVVTGDRGFEAFTGVSIEWLPTPTR